MGNDILTVMWKESKGMLRYSDSRWKAIVTLLTPIAVFGVIFPIQFREAWLTSLWPVAVSVFTPLLLIATTIAESFAGERERHTLETLLASRLPDRSILLGKLLTSMLFGWGMTFFLLMVSLVVVNLLERGKGLHFYQPAIFAINILLSWLVSGMVASLGVLISLRAPTVQSATQTLVLMLFMPFLLLQAVVFILPTFLPVDTVKDFFESLDLPTIMLILLLVLLLANIGLFLGAVARFQRSRLIL
jgi:ABC-2 type transport system permease protein